MGESTHTAPEMLPTFPGVHAIAVAPGCRTQLHLGVKAQLTGPGYQPEQLTADVASDVVGLAVPVQARQFAGHPGPGPTRSSGSAPGMGSHTATASETTRETPDPGARPAWHRGLAGTHALSLAEIPSPGRRPALP